MVSHLFPFQQKAHEGKFPLYGYRTTTLERRLGLFIENISPPQVLKNPRVGLSIYVSKAQQVQITCRIEAENTSEVTLSIGYNPGFFQLLNTNDKISLGAGSFRKESVWKLLPLRESSGYMELQLRVTDQDLVQENILRIVVEK